MFDIIIILDLLINEIIIASNWYFNIEFNGFTFNKITFLNKYNSIRWIRIYSYLTLWDSVGR